MASKQSPMISKYLDTGAQPALHFRDNFHKNSFNDVIMFIQPWYNRTRL